MTKKAILFFLLLLGMLSDIRFVNAAKRTYTWYPPPGNHETFEIYLETEDSWQTEVSATVLIRITLTEKHWSFDHVDIEWIKVELSTLKFSIDSGTIEETKTLRNINDYSERRINFSIPSDRLNRGENVSLSIIWSINIDIVDNVQWKHWVYTGSNSADPVTVSLYRPLLSPLEWLIIAIVVVVAAGTTGYVIYRKKRAVKIKAKENTAN